MASLVGLADGAIDPQATGEETLLLTFLLHRSAGCPAPEGSDRIVFINRTTVRTAALVAILSADSATLARDQFHFVGQMFKLSLQSFLQVC